MNESLSGAPSGFRLIPEAFSAPVSERYETELAALPLHVISMRGRTLRRRLAAFGLGFGTNFQGVAPAPELPPLLMAVLESAARVAALPPESFNQALVQVYPPGASIGWHRDAAFFGPTVIGVSFGGTARLKFRRLASRRFSSIILPPGSVYVMCGASRTEWEHSLSPARARRLSVTFRSFE
jgi:alkylated DNA repair dioxygenase AlkB